MFNDWKIISIVEICYYFVIIIASAYPTLKVLTSANGLKKSNPVSDLKPFFIRFWILLFAKFVAGILLPPYIHQLNLQIADNGSTSSNTNLLIASVVLHSIGLGFINILNLYIIEYIDKLQIYVSDGYESQPIVKLPGSRALRLVLPIDVIYELGQGHYNLALTLALSKLTFYAVILNAVASSRLGDDPSVPDRTTTRSILSAGSIIYISAMAMISVYIIHKYFFEKKPHGNGIYVNYIKKLLTFNVLITPFLLVRMIYNVCSAFTFNVHGTFFTNVSRFTFLFGDGNLYAGMVFAMEAICILWITCILWVIFENSQNVEEATGVTRNEYKLEEF
ncbi:hypothetical protein WICPIJ_004744 [Wickerhamomyces pijperi]|uniref:DUF7702 domain-containing protein n=1 Tax=Wickerhamomyces pijperi TaxID=599730 RepID=A0A9P8Q7H6_WICPI|nr:hypothetical protein WICPIJ_004744 [Wickerhamomyces pijperi]